ncbi:hypothetical protein AMS68_007678 [Peltaster fructicola]|uniref:Uncharacterized protein n=1 Tax=Peltaster fructicola TaxID=286661 RepID=A0A6H0Y5F7_9PEZI|nr:hypothetical protein AMS68_007678 [Peltaster fructicola]
MDPQHVRQLVADNPRLRRERDDLRKELGELRSERDCLQRQVAWNDKANDLLRSQLHVARSREQASHQQRDESKNNSFAKLVTEERNKLAHEYDALTKILDEERQRSKELSAKVGYVSRGLQAREKQLRAANRELAKLEGHTNRSKYHVEEDDDDTDYRENVHPPTFKRSLNQRKPLHTCADAPSTSKKRPHQEDEADEDATKVTKRMKAASVKRQSNQTRPVHSARVVRETTRRRLPTGSSGMQ